MIKRTETIVAIDPETGEEWEETTEYDEEGDVTSITLW